MREEHTGKLLALWACTFVLMTLAFASTDATASAFKLDVPPDPSKFDPLAHVVVPDQFETPVEPPTDLLHAIESASWSSNVVITMEGNEFRFVSNGYPDHELPSPFLVDRTSGIATPAAWAELTEVDRVHVAESPIDQRITLRPALAEEPTEAPDGLLAVLVNGAQLFRDPAEGEPGLESDEAGYVDLCNGHPTTSLSNGASAGTYHYHAVPTCTTDSIDIEGQHSSMVGVMIDGFPVYGSNDVDGVAITAAQLDACSGHFGPTPEFPGGIYHYHLLDHVGPEPIPCLSGELDTTRSSSQIQSGLQVRSRD